MGERIYKFVLDNKIILISVFLILAFTYIIRNDYIAADAFINPSEEYVFVTSNQPVNLEITPESSKIHSILLSIQNPSDLWGGV